MHTMGNRLRQHPWLTLLLTVGILLTSCGPSDAQIEELLATPVTEKVTVKWLAVGEGTEPWMQSAANDFVSQFNNSQDEIKLEMTMASGGGGISNQIEAGNIPDIVGPLSPSCQQQFLCQLSLGIDLCQGDPLGLRGEARALVARAVEGDIFRVQVDDVLQRGCQAVQRLVGKAVHDIDVEALEARQADVFDRLLVVDD